MKTWEQRFFDLNRKHEIELEGTCFSSLFRALAALGWTCDDEFWAPDLQVSRFLRRGEEMFVVQETYFDPKVTGSDQQVCELRNFISTIDPNEILYAGAKPTPATNEAEQNAGGNGPEQSVA